MGRVQFTSVQKAKDGQGIDIILFIQARIKTPDFALSIQVAVAFDLVLFELTENKIKLYH